MTAVNGTRITSTSHLMDYKNIISFIILSFKSRPKSCLLCSFVYPTDHNAQNIDDFQTSVSIIYLSKHEENIHWHKKTVFVQPYVLGSQKWYSAQLVEKYDKVQM